MIARALALLERTAAGASSRVRNKYYRALGVKQAGYVWLRAVEIPRNWADITLEPDVALDRGVVLLCSGPVTGDKLVIRSGTYVNRYTMFDAHEHLEVGRNCMIGPHCFLTDADHGIDLDRAVKEQAMVSAPVFVEDEVWIGAGAIVLSGVRIGRGAIVGAGSVVTHDIQPHTIVAGSPARIIRERSRSLVNGLSMVRLQDLR